MNNGRFLLTATLLLATGTALFAQSKAAHEKLVQRWSAEQVHEMRTLTHYKYQGALLYYSASFLVNDQGQFRPATEAEIRAVDILVYDQQRSVTTSVVVFDETLGTELLLLSRNEFEALVWERYSEADRAAYLVYKATATADPHMKLP